MGSRAVVVLCRDEDAARARFGVVGQGQGIVYTRTGRRFFDDPELEKGLLDRVARALTTSGLWDELQTDWVCLDAELMPWSAKALELVRGQYAAVGAASRASLAEATAALAKAAERTPEAATSWPATPPAGRVRLAYVDAYRRYCWPVRSLSDLSSPRSTSSPAKAAPTRPRPHLAHGHPRPRLPGRPRGPPGDPVPRRRRHRRGQPGRGHAWWED